MTVIFKKNSFLFVFLVFFAILKAANALQHKPQITGLSILDSKNTDIRLSAEQKGLVVVFLSSRCPCSNSHIKELADLKNSYPEFQFIGVHSNTEESTAEALPETKKYFQDAKLPFPILEDRSQVLADDFKALKTPHAFVISASGDIVYRGGVSSSRIFESADRKFLREALEDLKNNRAVKTAEGRTLGCAITREGENKWK